MNRKLFIICSAFLINGIMAIMTGTLLTYFIAEGMTNTQSGLIPSIQSAGNLMMGLLSGLFIHRFGKKLCSVFYCLCFAIGFSCILFSSSAWVLYPMIFISGLGWGICNNVCHLLAAERSSHTVILHCSYALGASVAPLIVKTTQSMDIPWRMNAWFVIIPALLLTLPVMTYRFDGKPAADAAASEKASSDAKEKLDFSFLAHARFYTCFFLYFFYNGVEACINSWLITYLAASGLMALDTAQTMLSIIWALIIVFRLVNILLLRFIPRHLLLSAQLLGLLCSIALLTYTHSGTAAMIFIFVLGMFMSGVSPCIAINSREFISGSGLSSGILFSGGGLGATILPAVVGVLIDAVPSHVGIGMIFTCICTAVLTAISVWNIFLIRRPANRS